MRTLGTILLVLLAIGCDRERREDALAHVRFGDAPGTDGSRRPGEQSRVVGAFDRIATRGSVDVAVEIAADTTVVVRTDDNLLDAIVTEVRDGTLHVEVRPRNDRFHVEPEVRVTVPRLVSIATRGSGDARITGLASDAFEASSAGSGDLALAGRATQLRVRLTGSGDVDGTRLTSEDVDLALLGSGDAQVHATRRIAGRAAGSGNVDVVGAPSERELSRVGSGTIRFR